MNLYYCLLQHKSSDPSGLMETQGYLEARFPDCPACQRHRPHLPRWAGVPLFFLRLLTALVLVLAIHVPFLYITGTHKTPLILFPVLFLALMAGWQLHRTNVTRLEAWCKRRMHRKLDSSIGKTERMARLVILVAGEAQNVLLGHLGVMDGFRGIIQLLLDRAGDHQYNLRSQLIGSAHTDLTDALTAISRLRSHRQKLDAYRASLVTYLEDRSEIAQTLYDYTRSMESNRLPTMPSERDLKNVTTALFNDLRWVVAQQFCQSGSHTNPAQVINRCLGSDAPDFLAAEKAVSSYMEALPQIPEALAPSISAD